MLTTAGETPFVEPGCEGLFFSVSLSPDRPRTESRAVVVATRGHVYWMITEYGTVNPHGMTLRERGNALISIAPSDFRAELARALGAIRHFTEPGFG